jgi:hypothetical protein
MTNTSIKEYGDYHIGNKGLLSRLITLSSKNIQNEIKSTGKTFDQAQYLKIRNYRPYFKK